MGAVYSLGIIVDEMAWTAIQDGDRIEPPIEELAVACNERLDLVGRDTVTFPDFSFGRRAEKIHQAITGLRNAINDLISPFGRYYIWPGRRSFCLDNYDQLSLEDLLKAAGYEDGEWIKGNRISDPAPWKQIQDVFDVLKHIRYYRSALPVSYITLAQLGSVTGTLQDAWDAALEADPTDFFEDYFYTGYEARKRSPAAPVDWTCYIHLDDVSLTFDLGSFDPDYPHTLDFAEVWLFMWADKIATGKKIEIVIEPFGKSIELDDQDDYDRTEYEVQFDQNDLSEFDFGEEYTIALKYATEQHPTTVPFDSTLIEVGDPGIGQISFRGWSRTYYWVGYKGTIVYGIEIDDNELTYG